MHPQSTLMHRTTVPRLLLRTRTGCQEKRSSTGGAPRLRRDGLLSTRGQRARVRVSPFGRPEQLGLSSARRGPHLVDSYVRLRLITLTVTALFIGSRDAILPPKCRLSHSPTFTIVLQLRNSGAFYNSPATLWFRRWLPVRMLHWRNPNSVR